MTEASRKRIPQWMLRQPSAATLARLLAQAGDTIDCLDCNADQWRAPVECFDAHRETYRIRLTLARHVGDFVQVRELRKTQAYIMGLRSRFDP